MLATRERRGQSALDGLLTIATLWRIPADKVGDLLGGIPRSTLYRLKTAAETLTQDQLTRISYLVGGYKALHILLPDKHADRWMTQPSDNPLFGGRPPLDCAVRNGIPGLQQIRSLLDAARGGL